MRRFGRRNSRGRWRWPRSSSRRGVLLARATFREMTAVERQNSRKEMHSEVDESVTCPGDRLQELFEAFSRRVIGGSMETNLRTGLVPAALEKARILSVRGIRLTTIILRCRNKIVGLVRECVVVDGIESEPEAHRFFLEWRIVVDEVPQEMR